MSYNILMNDWERLVLLKSEFFQIIKEHILEDLLFEKISNLKFYFNVVKISQKIQDISRFSQKGAIT